MREEDAPAPGAGYPAIPPAPPEPTDAARTAPPAMPTAPPYGAPAGPQPARLAGWVWPMIAGLALLIGVVGGVLGGAFFTNLSSDGSDQPGRSSTGLQGQGTTNVPPLSSGNRSVARVAATMLPSTVQVVAEYDGRPGGATGPHAAPRLRHVVSPSCTSVPWW